MGKHESQHHMDVWAALALLGVFTLGTIGLLLAGESVCRRVLEGKEAAWGRRSCAQYVADSVRSADRVELEVFGGVKALVLRTGDDPGRATRIYYHDGCLMELTSADGEEPSPGDGERVVPCNWMRLVLEEGLLTVDLLDLRDEVITLRLALRTGEGGAT